MNKDNRYIEAVGRRKTSVARVRITPVRPADQVGRASKVSISVNGREFENYFPTQELRKKVLDVFNDLPAGEAGTPSFAVTAKLSGGGIASQAEALRHGIARAMVESDHEFRAKLKSKGYLKRDPRAKERRKFGLKKARKAPQWSKR